MWLLLQESASASQAEADPTLNADGSKKTRCSFCKKYFPSLSAKARHRKQCAQKMRVQIQNANMNPLNCRYCRKEYESIALRRRHEDLFCHEKAAKFGDDVVFEEEATTMTTAAAAAAAEYIDYSATIEVKQVKCEYCVREFASRGKKNRHVTRYHVHVRHRRRRG